jgi:hypothetical protein
MGQGGNRSVASTIENVAGTFTWARLIDCLCLGQNYCRLRMIEPGNSGPGHPPPGHLARRSASRWTWGASLGFLFGVSNVGAPQCGRPASDAGGRARPYISHICVYLCSSAAEPASPAGHGVDRSFYRRAGSLQPFGPEQPDRSTRPLSLGGPRSGVGASWAAADRTAPTRYAGRAGR